MEIIFGVPPVHSHRYCAVDTEWFQMDEALLHRTTTGKFACMQICYDPETVYMVIHEEDVPLAMERIQDDIWVMHNSMFDLIQLRRFVDIKPRKKLWDTMLIERILFGGYYEFFSLKHLARRHLEVVLDKEARDLFIESTQLTPKAIEYAARDVVTTLLVQREQLKLVTKGDMEVWHKVDRPAIFAFMDFMGFRIDGHHWIELYRENDQKAKDLEAQLPFNPRSRKLAKQFYIDHGLRGLKNTSEEELLKSIEKHPNCEGARYAKIAIESAMYQYRASHYGIKLFETHREVDPDYPGVWQIIAGYDVTGAETGRTASRNPNMQNIPWKDTKEFRKCFIARPGRKLVILDYSAQEPRITAYMSGDPKLIKIFRDGKDIYIEMAFIIFGERIKKSDDRRGQMKAVILGMAYGLSEYGLAKRENISVEEARELFEKAWRAFPVSEKHTEKQRKSKGFVKTVMGRKFHINTYTKQGENNALNAPIQGTGGDMTKMAMVLCHRDWDYERWGRFAMVEETHDEMAFDAPEEYATEIAEFARKRMVKVGEDMCPGIPFEVDVHIGNSWADKE